MLPLPCLQKKTIPYYVLIIWWSCMCLKPQVPILILYHWPDFHIWCCLLTTNGAIILYAPVLDYHTWRYTVSMNFPSCLFPNTMFLVIILMGRYRPTLNRHINAYVWHQSMFHLLEYQSWCTCTMCAWECYMWSSCVNLSIHKWQYIVTSLIILNENPQCQPHSLNQHVLCHSISKS